MAKLHPLTKISIFFIFTIIPFILENIFDIMFILFVVIILILITRIPLFSKNFKKVIIGFLLVNVSIFIVWCLFSQREGNIVFFQTTIVFIKNQWEWSILITDTTLIYAARISLRIITMFFLIMFFFVSTSDRDLIHGLRSIKVPFTACLMVSLTFRGLAMFQQEYSIIKEAMMTRGVEFEHVSIPKKIKNFISIFIALIILMFKKTEDMSASIESRGIPLRSKNRTIYQYFPVRVKDFIIIIAVILFFAFIIYLRIINTSLVLLVINLFL
ncbi:MAG: energy-coupling factor transporter transmembrane component T family protein [Promethearchaeota archaeon]